eukprot:Rhum_TRINITY_DN14576_c17_g1::Rhum_TRINITY_DN14576_c17_g1_i1::g.94089::m.94089
MEHFCREKGDETAAEENKGRWKDTRRRMQRWGGNGEGGRGVREGHGKGRGSWVLAHGECGGNIFFRWHWCTRVGELGKGKVLVFFGGRGVLFYFCFFFPFIYVVVFLLLLLLVEAASRLRDLGLNVVGLVGLRTVQHLKEVHVPAAHPGVDVRVAAADVIPHVVAELQEKVHGVVHHSRLRVDVLREKAQGDPQAVLRLGLHALDAGQVLGALLRHGARGCGGKVPLVLLDVRELLQEEASVQEVVLGLEHHAVVHGQVVLAPLQVHALALAVRHLHGVEDVAVARHLEVVREDAPEAVVVKGRVLVAELLQLRPVALRHDVVVGPELVDVLQHDAHVGDVRQELRRVLVVHKRVFAVHGLQVLEQAPLLQLALADVHRDADEDAGLTVMVDLPRRPVEVAHLAHGRLLVLREEPRQKRGHRAVGRLKQQHRVAVLTLNSNEVQIL